ncbi:MFS transporter [Streptomyces sp. NPDC003023]|uniref:MFS transporter n=1 Tax=Streptomyces sp. NPDC003023 TaxID=3364675 RepID=UPI0036C17F97
MYLSAPSTEPVAIRKIGGLARRIPSTVVLLGVVSLLTDISAEMVTAVMPAYLLYGLGVGLLQLGVLDGVYTGATAMLRLIGGYAGDRTTRHKHVAALGYGLSALAKLGFPLAGASVPALCTTIAVDRAGKGIRTAPRDALISLSAPVGDAGLAFGAHRALDTTGALLGPVAAFGLLALTVDSYDAVFFSSFCIAAIAFLVLLAFVPAHRPGTRSARRPARLASAFRLLRSRRFRTTCLCAVVLAGLTVSDTFLFVAVQQRLKAEPFLLPLLPVASALVFLLAAVPLGRLSDRLGRLRVFISGHAFLAGACLLLVLPAFGWPSAATVLVLHGLFYASTDGVLMAHASSLLPDDLRGSGLALLQTGQAVGRMTAAVVFGAVAQTAGLQPSLIVYGLLLSTAIGIAALFHGKVMA